MIRDNLNAKDNKMKKKIDLILIPTDFSPLSYDAFSWAALLASKFDAKILILHVVSEKEAAQMISAPGNPWELVLQEEEKNMIDSFLASCVSDLGETLRKETLVEVGKVADKIIDVASERNAGMIIMHFGVLHISKNLSTANINPIPSNGRPTAERITEIITSPAIGIPAAPIDASSAVTTTTICIRNPNSIP